MSAHLTERPLLRNLTDRLANDNGQVNTTVEGIFEYVEELGDAASRSDWHEVRRLAELIFVDSLTFGYLEMAEAAEKIARVTTANVCLSDIQEPLAQLRQANPKPAADEHRQQPRRRHGGPQNK